MMGPLQGIRIIEFAGIGPGPFCGMMLADMGADVVRVDRASRVPQEEPSRPPSDLLARGRRSIAIDLKQPAGIDVALRLIEGAEALFEGFRPGVMERLGLGPDVCLERNPKLVYGRMTGWGQEGPYSQMAGHDINYIALAGALAPIRRAGQAPVPPLNLVGDFGGGGMFLALGLVAALLETRESGQGQVVDAAMVDGASTLITSLHAGLANGSWQREHATNVLDTGAHYYDAYETADGRYISLGSIEPQFYAELLRLTGLEDEELPQQMDRSQWPALKERLRAVFKTRTRDE
ncbi:MAG: CaiB/BaiF CoA-transferase family protein, partial [Chloroflexi bacterium]|nr:CaiB/BaiF CoA-transferase family protein [Chloroflexota bacterium]